MDFISIDLSGYNFLSSIKLFPLLYIQYLWNFLKEKWVQVDKNQFYQILKLFMKLHENTMRRNTYPEN